MPKSVKILILLCLGPPGWIALPFILWDDKRQARKWAAPSSPSVIERPREFMHTDTRTIRQRIADEIRPREGLR